MHAYHAMHATRVKIVTTHCLFLAVWSINALHRPVHISWCGAIEAAWRRAANRQRRSKFRPGDAAVVCMGSPTNTGHMHISWTFGA